MSTTRVLFVCLGNICRSPTAEATFAKLVRDQGVAHLFEIDSAGTDGWHAGELAHPDTRATAARRGAPITHRARLVTEADFDRFDHLLAMDASNLRNLHRLAKTDAHRAKARLFRELDPEAPPAGRDVPDPYYTGQFEEVFDICERTSRAWLAHLTRR
ncbi:MAG: low molecular weight protein-tyrosine-phosphatase [Sandaracinus sp.]